jgi:hypothetical protein
MHIEGIVRESNEANRDMQTVSLGHRIGYTNSRTDVWRTPWRECQRRESPTCMCALP